MDSTITAPRSRKKSLVIGGAVVAAALALGGTALVLDGEDATTSDPPASTGEVAAKDLTFRPTATTVGSGGVVTFRNNDDTDHTFTADGGLFSSGVVKPGGTFEFTFGSATTIAYHCEIHPGMTGSVTVK